MTTACIVLIIANVMAIAKIIKLKMILRKRKRPVMIVIPAKEE